MKSSVISTLCTVCLAAMSAAGASHWWSVNHFVTAFNAGIVPLPTVASVTTIKGIESNTTVARGAAQMPLSSEQKSFQDLVLKKFDAMENHSKTVLEQVAETNRDMMNLNFRVDAQSNSYRPLQVSENQSETVVGDGSSVLPPPPAVPVFPLDEE